jgi:thioredoxin-related protein
MMAAFKPIIATLLFIALSLHCGFANGRGIEFQHDAGLVSIQKHDRPAILIFGAAWCGWCRKMAAETLTDARVEALAGRFVWVKVDVDKQPELAARYDVSGVPSVVVIDKDGRVLAAQSGYLSADKFVKFATESLENPHPQEMLPNVLQRFANANAPAARKESTAQLVELLARPNRLGRDEILDAIQAKGRPIWLLLVDMLDDPRLSVRAAAAGALKHISHGNLPFQPFAPPEVRQQQIAAWQKWLASAPSKP